MTQRGWQRLERLDRQIRRLKATGWASSDSKGLEGHLCRQNSGAGEAGMARGC